MTLKRIDRKPNYAPEPLFNSNRLSSSQSFEQKKATSAVLKRSLIADFHSIVRRTGNKDLAEADAAIEQLRSLVSEQEFEEFKSRLHAWAMTIKKFDAAYDRYAFDMPDINNQRIIIWSILISFMAIVMLTWGIITKKTMAKNDIRFPIFNTLEEVLALEEAQSAEMPIVNDDIHVHVSSSLIAVR